MKIAIAKEHRDFFRKNGWIEFENIFSALQLSQLNTNLDSALAERLEISVIKLSNALPETLFLQGHDLWRSNEQLRQFVSHVRLTEVVSELIEFKPLRLGYDQILTATNGSLLSKNSHYSNFLKNEIILQDICSIKGLVAGVLICLNDSVEVHKKEELEEDEDIISEKVNIFPSCTGNITILNPETPLDFSNIIGNSKQRFYLITYAQSSSYYLHEPRDPHLHSLKKYGYSFHEKLTDKLNPIVYR